jgi:hypothetical protein
MGTVSQVAVPAGQALAGVLGDLVALPVLFGGAGVIFAVIGCIYAVVPALRAAFDIMELQLAEVYGPAGSATPAGPPGGTAAPPARG